MEIRPIVSAMLRNRTGTVLVALQIAITLAVVTNALFIINQRLEKIGRPSGMDTANLIFVQSYGYRPDYNHRVTIDEDLALIRGTPGVVVGLDHHGHSPERRRQFQRVQGVADKSAPDVPGNYYEIDEQGVNTLGVKLVAGRTFNKDIIRFDDTRTSSQFVPEVIVTRDMAKALFNSDDVVGRQVYDSLGQSATIVGVIDHMLGAWVDWDKLSQVVFHPLVAGITLRALCGARRAGPARRADGRAREEAHRIQSHACHQLGATARLLHRA